MRYAADVLEDVFDRTDGRCHLCHAPLARRNYGQRGRRGSWEVDHSVPHARGGTDHGNNLYPACISCNRSKRHSSTRSARRANGVRRAPLSAGRRSAIQQSNGVLGATVGGLIGTLLGGVPAAILLGVVGAAIGSEVDPES